MVITTSVSPLGQEDVEEQLPILDVVSEYANEPPLATVLDP